MWLDDIIEEQKHNISIMQEICSPHTPAELQEMSEFMEWDETLRNDYD